MLSERETTALAELAALLMPAHNPWWIIGRAAVVLHGADEAPLKAVEVLVSPGDARRLIELPGLTKQPPVAMPLFRSRSLLTTTLQGLPIEIMAGFENHAGGKWQAVMPRTRLAVAVDGAEVFIPECNELIGILTRFGRKKDLARAAALSAM